MEGFADNNTRMDDAAKALAETRTAEALADSPYQDFREVYREHLRWLKEADAQAFAQALSYYNEKLIPNIAGGSDPLHEWLDYGRTLAKLSGPGKIWGIDESGRAGAESQGGLLLHLPDDINLRALPLAIPKQLSPHQKSTLDLLVNRKLSLD